MKFFIMMVLLSVCQLSFAAVDRYQFSEVAQRTQFNALLQELRCLVCQNQNLADSDSDLAKDLRQEVYQKVVAKKSSTTIIKELQARYGDFILFKPPVQKNTWLLWSAPLILLLIGAGILMMSLRRQQMSNA